jgi:hypothetical protein
MVKVSPAVTEFDVTVPENPNVPPVANWSQAVKCV